MASSASGINYATRSSVFGVSFVPKNPAAEMDATIP